MTRLPMTTVRAGVSMALVLGATLAGLIGTGLIYTALTDHVWHWVDCTGAGAPWRRVSAACGNDA